MAPIAYMLPNASVRITIGTGKLNKKQLTECKCFTNGVPVLYRRDPTGVVYIPTHGSDEVAGLQRKKQASNPILR